MSIEGSNISFLSTIKEIESQYIHLPKSSRIRVEKWVERLVTTGGNKPWIRHRNAYARLLLGQVLAKKLTEPFCEMPATGGSLPPFPNHLLHHLRSVLGTHESSFWRDLYSRMDLDASKYDSHWKEDEAPISLHKGNDLSGPHAVTSIPNDTAGLKILIREQMARIALLEQQLQTERIQQEVDLQSLRMAVAAAATTPAPSVVKPTITSKIIPRSNKPVVGRPAPQIDVRASLDWLAPAPPAPPANAGLSKEEAAFMSYLDDFQNDLQAIVKH